MNTEMRALAVLTPVMNEIITTETDPNKNHGLVLPVRRASRDLVRDVDKMTYFADERCEEPENALSKEYAVNYPNFEAIRMDAEDNIETIRTHRVVSATGSQLAVYAKWFHKDASDEPLDARYADMMHEYANFRKF